MTFCNFHSQLSLRRKGGSPNSYDTAGRLAVVSDGTNTAAYSYVANSPLVHHIAFAHSGTAEMTTRYTNDFVNRLTGISSALNFAYQYNLAGQRISVTNGDGSYWTYGYDALGQVTNGVKHWGSGAVVAGQQFGCGFDTIGNRTMTLAGGGQNGGGLRQASYTANALNQYTSRTVPGAVDVIGSVTNTGSVWVDQTVPYRTNNYFWLALPVTNGPGPVYQTVTTLAALTNGNANNAWYGTTNIGHVFVPENPEDYSYDLDGNLLSDGHWNYTWDGENRLIALTNNANIALAGQYALAFAYDYQGRRIQKLVSTNNGSWVPSYTNRFVYDGWNCMAILNSSFNILNSFMWGTDLSGSSQGAGGVGGLLAENLAGNGVQFVAYDGNGNVEALVNAANGATTANYEYGPFGEVIRATGPMAKLNPFRFSTKYEDDETGLLYYGYRYYNPSTGRWIGRDPAEEDGSLNLYAILGNDPVDDVDYLGLVDYKFEIVTGTRTLFGNIGTWGQPSGNATGTSSIAGKTANSSVTITSRTKPIWIGAGDACNTVDGGSGQDGAVRQDSGTIKLYLRNCEPGMFYVFIDGSIKLTATGPPLAAPTASITAANGRILLTGVGTTKKPFSNSLGWMFPMRINTDWTLAATYHPSITVGPADKGKKATGTASGSLTFDYATPQ